jgi:tetratricopeptide (TPR) repeat protein
VGAIEGSLSDFEAATRVAESREDRLGISRSCLGASLALVHLGKLGRAEAQGRRAAQNARGGAGAELRSEAHRQLGNVVRERGDNRRALSHYRRAVKAARAAGATMGEAKALNNLGTVAQWLGRVEEALSAFHRSRELKKRAGARTSLHVTDNNLGALYLAVGRLDEGREVLSSLVEDEGAGGMVVAIARGNLGDLHALEERLDEAISCYRRTLGFCREQAFATQLSHILSGLIRVSTMRGDAGDLEQTGALLDELDELRHADIAESSRRLHTARAAVLDARGDTEAALAEARAAVRIADRETRFSDVFGTVLDARWQCAIYQARLGRAQAAARALHTCRKMLAKLVLQVGDLTAQRYFLHGHPLHRAVDKGELDVPRGWLWVPSTR